MAGHFRAFSRGAQGFSRECFRHFYVGEQTTKVVCSPHVSWTRGKLGNRGWHCGTGGRNNSGVLPGANATRRSRNPSRGRALHPLERLLRLRRRDALDAPSRSSSGRALTHGEHEAGKRLDTLYPERARRSRGEVPRTPHFRRAPAFQIRPARNDAMRRPAAGPGDDADSRSALERALQAHAKGEGLAR